MEIIVNHFFDLPVLYSGTLSRMVLYPQKQEVAMAERQHQTISEIPVLNDGLMAKDLNSAVLSEQPLRRLLESMRAGKYTTVPFDSGVSGIPVSNASYFRLVFPSRISPEHSVAVEFTTGNPEEAAELKADLSERLGEMALKRPLVGYMYDFIGAEVTRRVRTQTWETALAGAVSGYVTVPGSDEKEPHISLVYPPMLRVAESELIHVVEVSTGEPPNWLSGAVSEEPIISTHEERARRLAGIMAQSYLVHTLDY
jgi:hypothetical protein